jgi:hypothetical protein
VKRAGKSLLLTVFLSSGVDALTGEPLTDMYSFTACLMKLVDSIVPVVTLLFLLAGGITYISAAEDRKQRQMGKKYMMMGIIGIVCVKILEGIAAMPPFNLTMGLCSH